MLFCRAGDGHKHDRKLTKFCISILKTDVSIDIDNLIPSDRFPNNNVCCIMYYVHHDIEKCSDFDLLLLKVKVSRNLTPILYFLIFPGKGYTWPT